MGCFFFAVNFEFYKKEFLYSQKVLRNKTKYTIETENLIVAETKNPRKAPKDALMALEVSLLSYNNSPIKAPKKAPISIPKGMGDNKPIINPIVVP